MKLNKKILVILFFLTSISYAQRDFQVIGAVTNSSGIALSSVNIIAQEVGLDTAIIGYTSTNKQGLYSLKIKLENSKILVIAKALGYEENFTIIDTTKSNTYLKHNFILIKKPIQIQEVVIKQRIPLQSKQDTIIFDAKSFSDGTEKTVEDLLKKLPGIKVNPEGKITVKGKPIDKIMIEGEDFFSKNYRLITKNLTSEALDKIEAIDNYFDNPLLRGVEQTGKIVLNLKIKPELKYKIFGNAAATIGNKSRYLINEALFSLAHKAKFGIIGNINNTGYDPIMDVENEINSDNTLYRNQSIGLNLNNYFASQPLFIPNVDSKRATFNNTKLIAINSNYSLNNNLKIKSFLYVYNDKTSIYNKNNQTILLDSNTIEVYDSTHSNRSPLLLNGQIKLEYSTRKNTSIRWESNIKYTKTYNYSFLYSNNLELSEAVATNKSEINSSNSHHLNIVHRLKGKQALQFDLTYIDSPFNQNVQFESDRYKKIFPLPKEFKLANQDLNNKQKDLSAIINWKFATSLSNLIISSGYLYREEYLKSNFYFNNLQGQTFNTDSTYNNTNVLSKKIFFTESSFQTKWKTFRLISNLSLQQSYSSLQNQISFIKNCTDNFFVNYSFGIGSEIKSNKLFLVLSKNNQLPSINTLTSGYILENYRTFKNNSPIFLVKKNQIYMLSYSNMNVDKYYSILTNISFNRTFPSNLNSYQFTNTLNFVSSYPIKLPIDQIIINGQFDKLLPFLSLKLRWEGNLSKAKVISSINSNRIQNSNLEILDNKLSIITVFKSKFNMSLSVNWQSNNSKIDISKESNYKANLFNPNVIINFKPTDNLIFKISGESLKWSNNNTNSLTHFLDFNVRYSPNKSKWSLEVSGYNLFNTKQISYNQINNYSTIQNSYLLQPRLFTIAAQKLF